MEKSITERIFTVIEDNELNNSQLAVRLGVSRNLISEWKSGKTAPSPKIILKLLFHFPEVDANWLIRGTTLTNNLNQTAQNNRGNVQQAHGSGINMVNDSTGQHNKQVASYKKEIAYLKELLKTKEEQIELYKKLTK